MEFEDISRSSMECSKDFIDISKNLKKLNDTWVLWGHLPHNTDWSLKSFIKIYETNTIEHVKLICNGLPHSLVQNCMLFYMRKGINPVWEDPKNRDGGCFTYKVFNKDVKHVWTDLTYLISGESISINNEFNNYVNGITISPKKSFCIVKIWVGSNKYTSPKLIRKINKLANEGCRFKLHKPNIK